MREHTGARGSPAPGATALRQRPPTTSYPRRPGRVTRDSLIRQRVVGLNCLSLSFKISGARGIAKSASTSFAIRGVTALV